MADSRVNKLRYRAWRRGFLEADLILGPFADLYLVGFSTAQLDEFEALLDQADPDLYAWITNQADTPVEFSNPTLNLIKDFRFSAHAPPEVRAVRES